MLFILRLQAAVNVNRMSMASCSTFVVGNAVHLRFCSLVCCRFPCAHLGQFVYAEKNYFPVFTCTSTQNKNPSFDFMMQHFLLVSETVSNLQFEIKGDYK